MVEVQNKEIGYRINMIAGENIKILINDNEAFNETVGESKEGKVNFKFQESIFPSE